MRLKGKWGGLGPALLAGAAFCLATAATACAATTVAAPPAAVTPGAPTTTPGASGYVNPYTPPAPVAKTASNLTDPPGSWELYPSPTTANLRAVSFVDANDGWAVGYYDILRYQNGTWSVFFHNTRYCFMDVDMVSADDGWLVCMNFNMFTPEIWHWDGSNWTLFQDTPGQLNCIDMIDSNFGWAGDNPSFHRYNGSSWVTDGYAPDEIYDIQMNSDTDGRAVAYNYVMRRSGNIWVQETNNPDWALGNISMVNNNVGWAAGYYRPTERALIVRYNGSWQVDRVFTEYRDITALWALSTNSVWVASYKNPNYPYEGVLLYFDGSEWSEVVNPDPGERTVADFYFIDAITGWAVGNTGLILKYKPNITVAPSSLGRIKAGYHDR